MRFILGFFKTLLIIALVLYILIWLVPHVMPVKPDPMDEKPYSNSQFTRVDEVKVHYRYWASEADGALGNLILIHGFGGSTYSWRNNVLALTEAGYNVLTVDLPAFGYSDRSKGINHSSSARSALLWTVADRVGLQYGMPPYSKWHVVGHSMSGNVVAAMGALEPTRTSSLIFVNAPAADGLAEPVPFKRKLFRTLLPIKRVGEVAGQYYLYKPKQVKKMLRKAYGQKPDSTVVNAYMLALRQPRTASAVVESLLYSPEIADYQLDDIKQPALIIWGTEDENILFSEGEALDEALFDAQIREIKGAAHNPMETHPGEFNLIILDFLQHKNTPKSSSPTRQFGQ